MSDAPPNWAQEDASQPDYIANKDLAEKLRPILVNGKQILDDSHESGALEFISGDNITLTTQGNSIIISATSGNFDILNAELRKLIQDETNRATQTESALGERIDALSITVGKNTQHIALLNKAVNSLEEIVDIKDKTISKYIEEEIGKITVSGIPTATTNRLGGVKLSKTIGTDENDALEIKEVSTDLLVQGESTLVLNGNDFSIITW